MSFSRFDLDLRLLSGLRALGFENPTPIQSEVIPVALTGNDVMGSAETGTGKTAAFLLPILQRILAKPNQAHALRALILVPTRELVPQVAEQVKQLSGRADIRVATIYGGVGLADQQTALKRGVDIIIATPGRLVDHIERKNISFATLEVLVLDEADRMLDIGFLPPIRRIAALLPRERQTMLFSATMPQEILSLASEVTRKPVRVQMGKEAPPVAITQMLFPVPEHLKFEVLQALLGEKGMDRVIIFTRTRSRADRLTQRLQRAEIRASVIHGDRSQGQRTAALLAFRNGRSRILVATDIAARGIDVEGVSHVVNYDIPKTPEDYVHRIGRTGRANSYGQAYTLVTPADEMMVRRIESVIKTKIKRRRLDNVNYNAPPTEQPTAHPVRRHTEFNHKRPNTRRDEQPASQSRTGHGEQNYKRPSTRSARTT